MLGEEREAQKKNQEKFNAVTLKKNVENQNQVHNVKREGVRPQNNQN